MQEKIDEALQGLSTTPLMQDVDEINEIKAFLQWIRNKHFVFLGFQEYELIHQNEETLLQVLPTSRLGILRDTPPNFHSLVSFREVALESEPFLQSLSQLPLYLQDLICDPQQVLILTKADVRSTIHRPVYTDYIVIKYFDEQGKVKGERCFLGLYTSTAYHLSVFNIPLLRHKAKYIIDYSGYRPISHRYKALVNILEMYPRDELFQISREALLEIARGILQLRERQRIRLFVRPEVYGRFFSCMVYIPRDHYDMEVRKQMQKVLLQAFEGTNIEFTVLLSESIWALVHFVVYTPLKRTPDYEVKQIEARLIEVTRTWQDVLFDALIEQQGEEDGTHLFYRYQNAFPVAYKADFSARYAVYDINKIESIGEIDGFAMMLYQPIEALDSSFRFKLFHPQNRLTLSEVLPMLENMGVTVIGERAYRVQAQNSAVVWIQEFELLYDGQQTLDIAQIRQRFQETFAYVWRGEIENDSFNYLVLYAGLTWREIVIFRAYYKYLRQIGVSFSQTYTAQTLANNPQIVQTLLAVFYKRCDPEQVDATQVETLTLQIQTLLESVASLDEDRILQKFLSLIMATLRTNFFQGDPHNVSKSYVSFKFDPSKVPELPEPRPMFEIFVYSPLVEGVHLRGGKVARGGLRWSDRLEDFRTEILGLVKAQMVKNTVIVPVGSKGGFVVKSLTPESNVLAEGMHCYKTFIQGLLDLTDNLVEGQIVPPPNVVRYDDDDPYLVVAADKGTATFSDLANDVAKDYQFWLGDAFASGGSSGYDHKKMAITARGAWESVKRHFLELGKDIQHEDFTVIGIGDMSGDVFGNGLLLSPHIKLIGAFNHQHIFLDPDPDPQTSFQERQRLFKLPRSSWADYNTVFISKGGGVFSRTRKSILLSSEVRFRLGIKAYSVTPNELIRTLLKTEVDLLWNGGIGTYVKASSEHHTEVGDKTNDMVRVNAQDLRCKVIGEGGNLGFTQLGRIEYALHGGRMNTDAIDNSGGVDCSDHEVNIKILLDAIVTNEDMTVKQRNLLLSEMTEAVTESVMQNNYLQSQAISIESFLASQLIDVQARFMRHLEQANLLDRALEFLPSDKVLAERRVAQQGLTRPEIAVLMAYSKITLYESLLASDLPESRALQNTLIHYFPTPLADRFASQIAEHRLHREIIVARLANKVVNRVGSVFVYSLNEETGLAVADIVRAFICAWEIFGMQEIWNAIEALDNQVDSQVQLKMMAEARAHIERIAHWLLQNQKIPLDMTEIIKTFHPGVTQLAGSLLTLIAVTDREQLDHSAQELVEAGVPLNLATQIVSFVPWFAALDIVEVATVVEEAVEKVTAVYFLLGIRLRLHWLRDCIQALPRDNRWKALSRSALREELYRLHRQLTTTVLQVKTETLEPEARINAWMEESHTCRERCNRCLIILSDLSNIGKPDLAMLSVALREIRSLL
jgi:glutamate dehydrogenase